MKRGKKHPTPIVPIHLQPIHGGSAQQGTNKHLAPGRPGHHQQEELKQQKQQQQQKGKQHQKGPQQRSNQSAGQAGPAQSQRQDQQHVQHSKHQLNNVQQQPDKQRNQHQQVKQAANRPAATGSLAGHKRQQRQDRGGPPAAQAAEHQPAAKKARVAAAEAVGPSKELGKQGEQAQQQKAHRKLKHKGGPLQDDADLQIQQQQQQQQVHQPPLHNSKASTKQKQKGKRMEKRHQAQLHGIISVGAAGSGPSVAAGVAVGPAGTGPSVKAAAVAVPAVAAAAPKPGAVSCNWQALKQQLAAEAASAKPKKWHKGQPAAGAGGGGKAEAAAAAVSSKGGRRGLTPVVALDCEMVGVGPGGTQDALARVCIVNNEGNVLLDTFVAPQEVVVDYRTWVSGVRPSDLEGAPSFDAVQTQVAKMLEGRIVVGHSISKDFKVLLLGHPGRLTRDTARYPPFMFVKAGVKRSKSLKQLAAGELGLEIQEGSHSPVDDARAALYLYHKHRMQWEKALKTGGVSKLRIGGGLGKAKARAAGNLDVSQDPLADM